MRGILTALLWVWVGGCAETAHEPERGTVRVSSSVADAELFVDARERGALEDGMLVQLEAGSHVLEARADDRVISRATVEAQPGRVVDVVLAGPRRVERETADPRRTSAPSSRPGQPSLDELLREAIGEDHGVDGAPPSDEEPAHQTPTRAEVVAAMNAVSPAVRACGRGEHGVATTRLEIAPSGEVTRARVTSPTPSSELRRCVEEAAAEARVPPFTAASFTVNYPFRY